MKLWAWLERLGQRRRGMEGAEPMQSAAADHGAAEERLEQLEQRSASSIQRANAAIAGVHQLEDWLAGRDRRRSNRGRSPERRRRDRGGAADQLQLARASARRGRR